MYYFCNVNEKAKISMSKSKKQFKDFEISDFIDMGSLPKDRETVSHRPFFGFNKTRKGKLVAPYKDHPVSKLANMKPYTMEELLERAEEGRKQIAMGNYSNIDNVLRELDEALQNA